MSSDWKVLDRKLVLDATPWLKVYKEVVKLPDGRKVDDFYQIEQRDYVELIVMRSDKKILGLWYYKHGVKHIHLGLPAGYVEKNESPLSAAKRELLEECKLESDAWEKLGEFILEGNRGPAKAHFFMATDCKISTKTAISDDLEEAEPAWLTLDEWTEHLANGNVAVIGTATAILLAKNKI